MRFDEIRTQLLNRPMTTYQVSAVAIGVLVNMMDGFDLLAISFAGPAIESCRVHKTWSGVAP